MSAKPKKNAQKKKGGQKKKGNSEKKNVEMKTQWHIIQKKVRNGFATGKSFLASLWKLFQKQAPLLQNTFLKSIPFLRKCSANAIFWSFEIVVFLITITLIGRFHTPLLLSPLNLYDEGVSLLGAKRFSMGELPYRDFFTIYMPLKFTILGEAFRMFGANLLTARLFFQGISLLGFSAIYLLLRRSSHVVFAVFGTIFLSLFGALSLTPLFLVLLAWWIQEMTRKPSASLLPFLGGIFLGLLILLRIDFGGMMSIALLLLLFTYFLLSRKQNISFSLLFSILGKIGLGLFGILLPVGILFWKFHLFPDFWSQAISFPLFGDYQALRHLPWPETTSLTEGISSFTIDTLLLSETFAWFFWAVPFTVALGYWLYRGWQKDIPVSAFVTNMFLGFSTLGAFFYASHRSDAGHVLFLNVLGALFLMHLCTTFRQKRDVLFFLPFFALLVLSPAMELLQNRSDILHAEKKQYSFFPIPFPESPQNDNLQKVLLFFQEVPATEPVYVGVKDTS